MSNSSYYLMVGCSKDERKVRVMFGSPSQAFTISVDEAEALAKLLTGAVELITKNDPEFSK